MIFTTIAGVFAFMYLLLLGIAYVSWNKEQKNTRIEGTDPAIVVSVIVAFRNEIKNLPFLLNSLQVQQYPSGQLEVVFIDDHSTDGSAEWLLEQLEQLPFRARVYRNNTGNQGKKSAIQYGVLQSEGTLILCTDADCICPPGWVMAHASAFDQGKWQFISGPVVYRVSGKNFWHSLLQLEFASLVGAGGAGLMAGKPTMCNGANMSFSKEAFLAVNGYQNNEELSSGDDEFLMHKIASRFSSKIFFLKNREAIVSTAPPADLNEWVWQRKRWASKWGAYTNKDSRLTGLFVFVYNLLQCLSLLVLVFTVSGIYAFVFLWIGRMLMDFLFLRSVCRFLKIKWSYRVWVIAEILYPSYAVIFGLWGRVGKYHWKNRKVA